MSKSNFALKAIAGGALCALALAASGPAQAAVLTFDMNVYDTSAVDATPGVTQATMTVTDSGSNVNVVVTLEDGATLFASTGGSHITIGWNLNTAITSSDVTVTSPFPSPAFTFQSPINNIPGPSGGFGNMSAGLQGVWNGTSSPATAGPIDFTIAGVQTSNFVANAKGFFAVADVLGSKGTGEVGANTVITGVPEPSTWGMMLIGFAGLGFAAFRRSAKPRLENAIA